MSKSKNGRGAVRPGADAPAPDVLGEAVSPIPLTPPEQWSGPHDDLPTVQEVVEGMGLQLLGAVDAPTPPVVPAPVLAKIRHWDVEWAAAGARRQEYLELAVELLGIDTARFSPTVNIDTGVVALVLREGVQA